MDGDHYFSATPAAAGQRRAVRVRLRGTEVDVVTAAGVFSPERVDLGTRVLLREAPDPPSEGDLLDLGCGWGPLALALGLAAPRARVWAVDVNTRALELCQANAASLGLAGVRAVRPDEVPDHLHLDALWSNPPIRVGKQALHEMLLRWLPRLRPGASAHLVVQRHLGADSLHAWLADQLPDFAVERAGSAKGYRVLRATRRRDAAPAGTPGAAPT